MNKAVAVLACILIPSSTTAATSVPYQHDATAVVRLTCGNAVGTGVKLENGLYITAAHVVEGGNCEANGVPVVMLAVDDTRDYAIFLADRPGGSIRYTCKGFKAGEVYVARGFAEGWDIDRMEPLLATELVIEGYTAFIGSVIPGMSGGPAFNKKGEVVGIVNMRWPARLLAIKDTVLCKD